MKTTHILLIPTRRDGAQAFYRRDSASRLMDFVRVALDEFGEPIIDADTREQLAKAKIQAGSRGPARVCLWRKPSPGQCLI